MTELVNPEAAQLWRSSLDNEDRVLVIGASGWFGQTTVALLNGVANPRMLVASTAREIVVGDETAQCVAWNMNQIRQFAPTVIIDCAFLTRDLIASMPLPEYVERNSMLTRNMIAAAGIDSVSSVITVSSGAAVYPRDARDGALTDNPYGWLKRDAELTLGRLAADRGISAIVARAWSVSGAFVAKPRSYAFSDMILQALDGRIQIMADRLVYRRYVSVEDLLAISLASASRKQSATIESGGSKVEMRELAEAVAQAVNPAATIDRVPLLDKQPDNYFSTDDSWDDACQTFSFSPAPLSSQIETARHGISRD